MININLHTLINEIEMYDNCGILSNNIIDYEYNNKFLPEKQILLFVYSTKN